MTTAENILLIVLAALMIIFFLMCIVAAVLGLKLLGNARRVVTKADEVAESVGEAAEALRDAHGRLAVFKLIRNIVRLAQKRSRK